MRFALTLAAVGLVAASIGALGPADRVHTTYSWPPDMLPAGSPERLWYTPLLLAAHRPEAISATIPCELPPSLALAGTSSVVLATARQPQQNDGLVVTRAENRLTIGVGKHVLERVALPSRGGGSGCAYLLRLAGGRWSINGGQRNVTSGGTLDTMPRVNGLFSELDLRVGTPALIEITTISHATRTTIRQTVAWLIAALTIAAALLLVAIEFPLRRPWSVAAGLLARGAIANAHPTDAVVALALLGWWVIAPIGYDDGWVQAREQMFSSSGGFSLYYTTLGGNLPLDYWVEWAHHWLAQTTNMLLFLRIPTLICLSAMWVLCRWILTRVTSSLGGPDPVVLWALACAFLAGALAWGMTLRPEPVTALLFTGVLACMVRFLEHETVASVAAAAALVALALPAHPTGFVSLAPVLVASPRLLQWARRCPTAAATLVAAASALLVVLVFVGSDIEQRRLDVELSTIYSPHYGDEFSRYANLTAGQGAAPLRRMAVGLIMLAALAFVLRHRRKRAGLLDFPAPVLAVAAVLFIATPSKWAWHFGALIGAGAVAVASETARLRVEGARSSRWQVWPFLAVGAAAAVGYWAWRQSPPWNPVDLRTLTWYDGLASALSLLAILVPLYLVVGAFLIERIRGRRATMHVVPWRVAAWTAALLTVPVVAYTVGILVVDAAKTASWTLTRQNLETIVGDAGCGLADDLLVPLSSSPRPLPSIGMVPARQVPAWVPSPPVTQLERFVLSPEARQSSHSPWFTIPKDRRLGLFVAGTPAPSDNLLLDWGRIRRGRVETLRTDDFARAARELPGTTPWRFFAAGELPRPDPAATVVRVSFRSEVAPGSALAVTAPVVYQSEQLSVSMNRAGWRSLVYPELLPYIPCTNLSRLFDGTVEVPHYVALTDSLLRDAQRQHRVLTVDDLDELLGSSPFLGVMDLYQWERMSLADTKNWPRRVFVFAIDQRIPGAKLVPPEKVTFTS